jgi:hypothetical protein
MIVLGALIAVWGVVVLSLARPLHASWKGMLADVRRDGVQNTIPGTRLFASPYLVPFRQSARFSSVTAFL